MKYTREQYFRIWLAGVDGIGAKSFARLLKRYGSAEAVWEGFGAEMRWIGPLAWQEMKAAHSRDTASEMVERVEHCGATVVFQDDREYPPLLREIADPPALLYVRGRRDISDEWCIAIVGTRTPTAYGLRMARQISGELARSGATVVSGFARGIDSAAHTAAVGAGGRTTAILGCGVDVIYPPENVELFERILDMDGSIVSEFPPGSEPRGMHFPMRNRIISGMSRGVLMVEGLKGSGALHTVKSAIDQNREVFVLPGQVDSPTSETNHMLARDGARIITSAVDILEDLRAEALPRPKQTTLEEAVKTAQKPEPSIHPKEKSKVGKPRAAVEAVKPPVELTDDESRVFAALESGQKSVDRLVELTGLSAAIVNTVLTTLAMKGIM